MLINLNLCIVKFKKTKYRLDLQLRKIPFSELCPQFIMSEVLCDVNKVFCVLCKSFSYILLHLPSQLASFSLNEFVHDLIHIIH